MRAAASTAAGYPRAGLRNQENPKRPRAPGRPGPRGGHPARYWARYPGALLVLSLSKEVGGLRVRGAAGGGCTRVRRYWLLKRKPENGRGARGPGAPGGALLFMRRLHGTVRVLSLPHSGMGGGWGAGSSSRHRPRLRKKIAKPKKAAALAGPGGGGGRGGPFIPISRLTRRGMRIPVRPLASWRTVRGPSSRCLSSAPPTVRSAPARIKSKTENGRSARGTRASSFIEHVIKRGVGARPRWTTAAERGAWVRAAPCCDTGPALQNINWLRGLKNEMRAAGGGTPLFVRFYSLESHSHQPSRPLEGR